MNTHRRLSIAILLPLLGSLHVTADEAASVFFETRVRPLLIDRCQKCHGDKKQSGGLRVDSREALIAGGDRGPAMVPGDPPNSLLIQAVTRVEEDLHMPPKNALSEQEIAYLEKWVKLGAVWPSTSGQPGPSNIDPAETHWAFQNIRRPPVPRNDGVIRDRGPIDAFVRSQLDLRKLAPSPDAEPSRLIRRLSYCLTGLPPAAGDVERFEADPSEVNYRRLVNQYLSSPAYGEHWARRWLDLARYSDSKGYVYAREERHWVHSWAYRDWVAAALNQNMPYDRFLLLQLAADQIDDRRPNDLAAMGFLTLGRRFLGNNHDIIDDRIDVVTRSMLGLTVSCARCHDHKYDPIPTADYYSLYGVFNSCRERLIALGDETDNQDFYTGLQKRQQELAGKIATAREESTSRCRQRVVDYLRAQLDLSKFPPDGFDQIFSKSDLLPVVVHRWDEYLHEAQQRKDPVFIPWHAYRDIPTADFADRAKSVTTILGDDASINPVVARRFRIPPESFDEVIQRYGELFDEMRTKWEELVAQDSDVTERSVRELPDAAEEEVRRVLYQPGSPCVVPDEPIVHIESFFDSGTCTDLWKKQSEVYRWIIREEASEPFALVLNDRPDPREPRIFRRGNPLRKADAVPRRFLSLLSPGNHAFEKGSGRLELAHAIADPRNPLTARVIVNRIWAHHFGVGLVTTTSDFGTRADLPSHPNLLDWLASQFVREGWDMKRLHRRIVLSSTFRQTSAPIDDERRRRAEKTDPDNRLLWRMNARRLSFEEFCDSLLMASGQLDRRMGGKPVSLLDRPFPSRRTLYASVDRQYLPGTHRVFDFANPDLHVPQRAETTVPQQALFLMNHPLVLSRVSELARRAKSQPTSKLAIETMFRLALQRSATPRELADAIELLKSGPSQDNFQPPVTQKDWQYGFGEYQTSPERVLGFTRLPHFTGTTWQGGAKYPDGKLGWVQLTARGGHPGNDRQHAVIRRWTAPRTTTVRIESKLIHEAAPGDGIRAFVVSSKHGLLASAIVHQTSVDLNVDAVKLAAGDTIDFVVDIGDVLNNDQHLWNQVIRDLEDAKRREPGTVWNSQLDFPQDQTRQIDAWERLAQVLICTNEFSFID